MIALKGISKSKTKNRGYKGDVNKYITLPHSSDIDFEYNQPFSIEAFIKFDATDAGINTWIFTKLGATTAAFPGIQIFKLTGNNIRFEIGNSASVRVNAETTFFFSTQVWYHLVFTYDGNNGDVNGLNVYVNGILQTTTTKNNTLNATPATIRNTQPVYLFTRSDFNTYSKCTYKQLRIFNKELTSSEVIDLYNYGFPLNKTAISGCVREYIFSSDTYSAGTYLVKENISGNHGTSFNMTGVELITTTFTATYPTLTLTNNTLYYDTYKRAGGDFNSPFTHPCTVTCQAIYRDGYTWFVWMTNITKGNWAKSLVMRYDHDSQTFSKSFHLPSHTRYMADAHQHYVIIDNADGDIIAGVEDGHLTPIYLQKINKTTLEVTPLANVSTNAGYSNFARIGSDIYLIYRKQYRNIYLSKSTDGGTTWGAEINVMEAPFVGPTANGEHWLYPLVIYSEDKIHLVINKRYNTDDFNSVFVAWCYMVSTDGITWRNVSNTFTKNVSTSGAITLTEAYDNCLVHTVTPPTNAMCEHGCISPTGNIYLVGDKDDNGYIFCYWNGSSWVKRDITGLGQVGLRESKGLICIDDNTFDLYAEKSNGTKQQIVRFRTNDKGLTWTQEETVTTNAAIDHNYLVLTHNAKNAAHVMLACNAVTSPSNYNDIFFKAIS